MDGDVGEFAVELVQPLAVAAQRQHIRPVARAFAQQLFFQEESANRGGSLIASVCPASHDGQSLCDNLAAVPDSYRPLGEIYPGVILMGSPVITAVLNPAGGVVPITWRTDLAGAVCGTTAGGSFHSNPRIALGSLNHFHNERPAVIRPIPETSVGQIYLGTAGAVINRHAPLLVAIGH